MFVGQLEPVPAIKAAAAAAGREPLRQWAQGGEEEEEEDDHDACNDEFSSCGQLDPSERERVGGGVTERERGREEEGFHRGGMEKWTLKNKSRILGGDLENLFH